MTVGELKRLLQNLPDQTRVCVSNRLYGFVRIEATAVLEGEPQTFVIYTMLIPETE